MEFTTNLIIWSGSGLILLLLELGHPGLLLFLPLALGAFSAAGATFWWSDLLSQSLLFAGVSLVGLLLTQWWLSRTNRFAGRALSQTNVYALVGKTGQVLAPISNLQTGFNTPTGYVKIDGEVWLAKSGAGTQQLEPGATVLITGVKGCHVIVKLIESEIKTEVTGDTHVNH